MRYAGGISVPPAFRIRAAHQGTPVPVIRVQTVIRAPIERCFDLARDPDIHTRSVAHTSERIVNQTGSGLLDLGDTITFESVHFSVRQQLTARITRLEHPHNFEDQQVQGAFRGFRHQHIFETIPQAIPGATLMTDIFAYRAPLGPVGRLAERLVLTSYLRRFLAHHAAFLKRLAEQSGQSGRGDGA